MKKANFLQFRFPFILGIVLMVLSASSVNAQVSDTIVCNATANGTGQVTLSGSTYTKKDSAFVGVANTTTPSVSNVESYAVFNLNSIPAGATITAVSVYFDIARYGSGGSPNLFVTGTNTDLTNITGATLYNDINTDQALNNGNYTGAVGLYQINVLSLSANGIALVHNNLGNNNISLGFYAASGTQRVYSIEGRSSSVPPRLIVTYTVPCSGTPAAGTVSPSSAALSVCTPSKTLTLSGYNGITGLTYQWEQSTNGGITYSPISGATNTTYSDGLTGSSEIVNCVTTCSVSNLSTTSGNDTTTYTQPGYFSVTQAVPYTQGFESGWITKCGTGAAGSTDDVPDVNCVNTPASGNSSWRRDDDGASAGWTLSGSFPYSPAGSNANGGSSLHSARLHTGESAATGTLDVYLDMSATGTKQVSYDYINTSGADFVTVYLSTNGPSGPFVQMDKMTTSGTWATRTFTDTTTSATCILRFAGGGGGGLLDLGLDNVAVTVLPSCSGAPVAGSPVSNTAGACASNSITLNLSGATLQTGITYQWQSSTDSITFTPISGATTLSYTFVGQTVSTYYNCVVSCGTNSSTSNAVYVAETPCYCSPTWQDGSCSPYYVTAITGGGINYTSTGCPLTTNFTNTTTTIAPNVPTSFTITTSTSNQFNLGVAVWVDFNNDGNFNDAGDLLYHNYVASVNSYTFSITIPAGTPGGSYRMRILDPYQSDGVTAPSGSTPGPCGTYFAGTDQDFTLVVPGPALTTSVDSLPGFSTDACTNTGAQSFSISATNLSPASGSIVVTAPAGFNVSSNGIAGFAQSATISYSGSAISAQNVFVKFEPASGGLYSGNITFSGGGLTTAPVVVAYGTANGLTVSSTTEDFGNAAVGVPSAGLKDTLSGYNLTAGVDTVTSSNPDFQVSPDSVTWTTSYTFSTGTSLPATPIYIRLVSSAAGSESAAISVTTQFGTACTPVITATGVGASPCSTPSVPTNMVYTNTTDTGVTINFTSTSVPDGYILVQSSAPFSGSPVNGTTYAVNAPLGNGIVVATGAAQPFVVTGLTGNTTYYFTVIAFNGGATGVCGGGPVYGGQLTSSTTSCIGTPSALSATNITSSGFTASWVAPVDGGAFTTAYTVDVSANSAFTAPVTGSPFTSSSTSLVLNNLTPNTVYYFRVTATAACSSAPSYTDSAFVTPFTYISMPIASGFNSDVVANGVTSPAVSTTVQDGGITGGFDGSGNVFVSSDYNYNGNTPANGGAYSLPLNGNFTSAFTPGLPYQLAGYSSNNALVLTANAAGNTGTLAFTTPEYANIVYVAGCEGNVLLGTGGTTAPVTLTVTFADNSTQIASVTYPSWTSTTGPIALTGTGKVLVTSGIASGSANSPNIFEEQIVIAAANYGKKIQNVVVTTASGGAGYVGIFAVSARAGVLNTSASTLSALDGYCAAPQSFVLNGNSLGSGGSITVNAPTGFEVSADNITWASTATIGYTGTTLADTTIYVRVAHTAVGAVSGNITFTGGTVNNPPVVAVSGTGTGIAVSPNVNNFGNVTVGTTSATQVDSISGTGLTAGTITLNSPNIDFQISTDSVTFGFSVTINVTASTLAATPVYIRLIPFLAATDTSIITLSGAGSPCTATITAYGVGISCVPGTWVGITNTDWATASNWSCSTIPDITSAVTVSATAPHMPAISSGTYSAASFALAPGATLTLSTGTILNVAGQVSDSGTVSGAGTMVLNGGTAQTYKGNGTINNLTVSNATTITSGSTLNLTGVLTMTAGQLTTNSGLVLVSNASGTARIATITGGNVFGIVKVQQYIPGNRRAFRFLAHPFTASIGLSQIEANMDITGPGYPTSGFTWSGSASPSAFWYNTITGNASVIDDSTGWLSFTNTNGAGNNAWSKFEGIRILARGTPGQGLDGLPYTPNPVTLHLSGQVNQGTMTEQLQVGDSSGYNLLGNPYPSPTDIGTVIGNAAASMSGSGYWVWNPEAQLQGAYRVQLVTGGAYFLPANASFMVNAAIPNTLVFNETNKGTAPTSDSLFKLTNTNEGLTLNLYDSMMNSWDIVYMSFNSGAAASLENYDARHLHNSSLDFYSFSSNNQKLSIDARPYVSGQVVPLGIGTNVHQKYIIKTEGFNVPSGAEVYLHDKYLNQYQQLQEGSEYTFSITSDPASQGDNRFELSMAGTISTGINNVNGSNGLKVSMVPNPATEQVTITYEAPKSEHTTVRIMSMTGQSVVTMDLGDEQSGNVIIPLRSVAAGMYLVELTSGTQTVTQRLVKQ